MNIRDLANLGSPRHLSLAYHAVDPQWPHLGLSVPLEAFEAQLHELARRGYRGVTFSEAVLGNSPDHVVSITFDDAYCSVLEYALPALRRLGWPATVFAPTEYVASGRPMTWLGEGYENRKRQLTWAELSVLAGEGWEIGSHGRTHRLLSSLDDAELEDELAGSRAEIADHLGSCTSIAYPWGEMSDRVVEASRRVGYTTGSGLWGKVVDDDPLRIPRQAISGVDGRWRMALKTSGLFWALRSSGLWDALDRARGLEGRRDVHVSRTLRARVQAILALIR